MRGAAGLIKYFFFFGQENNSRRKESNFEVIVFEIFPLVKTTVVVFLNSVICTDDVSVKEET